MFCFAYGSHLDSETMRRDCPRHRVVGLASLADHTLGFPRFSPQWGGGVASPQLAHGRTVWGVVYDLDDDDVAALDRLQGWVGPQNQHNLCDRDLAAVELTRPDDGSIPRRVRALLYVARPYNPSPPTAAYMETVLRGARHHGLPEDYLAELSAIPVEAEGRTE
jgi:hypothetical protein